MSRRPNDPFKNDGKIVAAMVIGGCLIEALYWTFCIALAVGAILLVLHFVK